MSRESLSDQMVGNDFLVARPKLRLAMPVQTPEVVPTMPLIPVQVVDSQDSIPVSVASSLADNAPRSWSLPSLPSLPAVPHLNETVHRYSLITFALLFLVVGSSGTLVAGRYIGAHIEASVPLTTAKASHHTIAGLNLTVPHAQLQAKIQSIMSQSATFTIGGQTMSLNPDRVKSWLQITPSKDGSQDFIHVNAATITASMNQLANEFVKAPVNQVTITHADGSSQVVVAGKDGAKLTAPSTLKTESQQYAKTLMDAKGGLNFNTPLQTVPFQAVTQANFDKLIEINVVTKQMDLYQNGSLWHSYAVSAGAPATPTPLGEYHIFAKYATQDMKGTNPNGTPYFQPHVHWINYFLPGGYAVHGNYWRPLSVFGSVNTSHGCVSLPDSLAEQVYDWAPVGTTVITHG